MNCAEFENYLPEAIEGTYPTEAEQHLRGCGTCLQLAADLTAISQVARELQDSDGPGPQVWNSIEAALRQEGVIQDARSRPYLVAGTARRWQPAWLLPVAAAFLLAFGVVVYQRGTIRPPVTVATNGIPTRGSAPNGYDPATLDDPTQGAEIQIAYRADLKSADAYIVDAKATVDADPNDEQAQQALAAAYEQRSMVYEMALDRSLP